MNIYPSTKPAPYVYKLVNKITGKFYIGYRCANKVPSSEDIGFRYFTSSSVVKPIFSEFSIEIIAEFFDKVSAFEFEQNLIKENWDDPLILNRSYRTASNVGTRQSEKQKAYARNRMLTNNPSKCPVRSRMHAEKMRGRKASLETREKMSKTRTGKKLPKRPQQSAKCKGSGSPLAKTYIFIGPDLKFYVVTEGLFAFCKEKKIGLSTMQKMSSGKIESYNGWVCVFSKPNREINLN